MCQTNLRSKYFWIKSNAVFYSFMYSGLWVKHIEQNSTLTSKFEVICNDKLCGESKMSDWF